MITDPFDELVKRRQKNCPHGYNDRVVANHKTFCGKCGLEEN